jgi:trk system potassium uptake protein TrkH
MILDLRPVLWGVGLLLSLFAAMMALPAIVDWAQGDSDSVVFFAVACFSLFCGQVLIFANLQQRTRHFTIRQGILLAVIGWVVLATAASMPFAFGHLRLSPTDALFEATSGITATNGTVLRHLDHLSPGILLWRALLQWMGGIGVLTLSAAVLPDLNVGGMLLFRTESARLDERLIKRVRRLLSGILAVYAGLTLLLGILLWLAGMAPFDAVLHALSTISCGGFSSSDQSIGHWHNPGVDWVILVGMLLGGAPFMLHWQIVRRQWREVGQNSQIRWYLALIVLSACAIAVWLVIEQDAKPLPALRHSLFAVTSVMTGTGFATLDWSRWSGFPIALLFLLTFVGGCAGSTAGGLRVFRLQLLSATARLQLRRLLSPNKVLLPKFDGRVVPELIPESVLGYLFVYILSFAMLAMGLSFVGLDFPQALSAAAASLANLGPAISPSIGPLGSFAMLPDAAKWLLACAMLFGRLELFLVLTLFSRDFWQD